MCSKPGQLVADLLASSGASFRACKASGRHYFGMEGDKQTFNKLLKPLCCPPEDSLLLIDRHKTQPWHINRSSK